MNGDVCQSLVERRSWPNRLTPYAIIFFWATFLLSLGLFATRAISDPDFWWHLKTGEVMVQQGGLLQFDPFTFSGDNIVSVREALILKGYWLWQLIAYGLYALFGFKGIFFLNLLVFFTMAGVLFQQMRSRYVHPALAALLLTLCLGLLYIYAPERPQTVSFLFAMLLFGLLAKVRDGGDLGWRLPLLMMTWANLHGGFVVGDLILLCFAAGIIIEFRHDLSRMRHFLLWILAGIGASLLNPNGVLVFGELFNFYNSSVMSGVTEYQNTWVTFLQGDRVVSILWLLIVLYAIGVWSMKKYYWPELFVAFFLAYISVMHSRNIIFFPLIMLPCIGEALQQGWQRRGWQFPAFIPPLVILLCSIFILNSAYAAWQQRRGMGEVKNIYPEAAISFMQESGMRGRLFNSYEYGGYLLWRLFPQIQVFIDGRGLDPRSMADWRSLSAASFQIVNGRRVAEALLADYRIDYVIQPIYQGDGRIQPLMKMLLPRQDWLPIYLDSQVYIFAHLSPANTDVIDTHRIDENEFTTRLLLTYNFLVQRNPGEIGYHVALAGLQIYLGMYSEAKAQIEAIMAISPSDQSLLELRRDLNMLEGKILRESRN